LRVATHCLARRALVTFGKGYDPLHQEIVVKAPGITRRRLVAGLGSAAFVGTSIRPAWAADKVRFLTSWFAQAEHGGFYAAKANGIYAANGLDVDINMGGPQINAIQLLTGGNADLTMGYDLQTLNAVENGVPVVTVGASFQFDLQGIMAHPDVKTLSDLKGHKILIASSSHTTFWPWLREKYGFTEDMAAPYTFNLQPFFTDPTVAQQAYATSETFQAQKANVPISFFLLAKYGYPTYGSTIITTQPFVSKNPSVVKRFVAASMEGWKTYLRNPGPANALIKIDNPKMTDEQLAYSLQQLKATGAVTSGDASKLTIGAMTDVRWKSTRDFLVRSSLLKASTDWKSAYSLDFVKNLHVVA
jgi:NitT/TauT family transport system substrate-binding protein